MPEGARGLKNSFALMVALSNYTNISAMNQVLIKSIKMKHLLLAILLSTISSVHAQEVVVGRQCLGFAGHRT